jgi:hypothetical protein
MHLIIPFNKHELTRSGYFLGVLKALGCYSDAIKPIVMYSPDVASHATEFVEKLSAFYPKTVSVSYLEPLYEPYPKGANLAFREAVLYMKNLNIKGDKDCWYFFELDNTPLRKTWAEDIRSEYYSTKSAFLGHVKNCLIKTFDDNGVPTIKKDGVYMVGTGVYPANYHTLTNTYKAISSGPFDIYARYVSGKKATNSALIRSRGQSKDFNLVDGYFTSVKVETGDPNEHEKLETTAVLHGCKDSSLHDIVVGWFSDKKEILETPAPEVKKTRRTRKAKSEDTAELPLNTENE